MRALVQRVSHASVTIDGRIHGQIGQGFLVLLGITDGDTVDDAVYLADKTVKMRVFTDENDKMNRSLADVGGGLLIVSQFTLYGDCRKGNRPSYIHAAPEVVSRPLYERFAARVAQLVCALSWTAPANYTYRITPISYLLTPTYSQLVSTVLVTSTTPLMERRRLIILSS